VNETLPASATLPTSEGHTTTRDAKPNATRPPLKIAFALGGTDLGRSGIGTYVREVLPPLIEQLGAEGGTLIAFGHASELDAYADVLERAPHMRVPVSASHAGLNALWHLARGSAFARRSGADVLVLPAANRRLVARATLPCVAVVHDLAQLRVAEKYDRLRMFYFNHVLLRALRRPMRLIAVSGATRDDLVGALRLSPERVHVVYNGVNTAQFRNLPASSPRVREARAACGLETRPYLFYPARLEHPGKNHVRLLRAFARSGLGATHTLALSGGDWGAGALLRATIRELALDNDVKLLGFVSKEQLPALMAGADAVLMLGLHEGFGLPALEGLSAGKPVCVSCTGALPEVAGPLGVLCDPLDEDSIARALRRVVDEEALRSRCRRDGPTWAERFTWSNTARGVLDACHEAAEAFSR
jgi:glycosyltransferase involved in cell wall biosynthesis